MTLNEVNDITKKFFESKFLDFEKRVKQKIFTIDQEYSYPNTIRLGETNTQWIIELIGSTIIQNTKKYTIHPAISSEIADSTDNFINLGFRKKINDSMPLLNIAGHNNIISNLALATPYDEEQFKEKLNFNTNLTMLKSTFQTNSLIKIASSSDKIILDNIDFIQSNDIFLFFKRITCIIVIQKETQIDDYYEWLEQEWVKRRISMRPDFGISLGTGSEVNKFALDLSGLSNQDLSEKIIDTFIVNHKDHFCKALGHVKALPQLKLPLIDKNGFDKEDKFLQPDYLLKRPDGYYDILDLKRSLVREKSLVKGKRKRIRFKDYTSELIAQLEGYKRYFKSKEHIEWANKFNIKISNPRLYGIVGNHNNFVFEDVSLALDSYKDDITLMSYAGLVDLLRTKN